MSKKKPTTNIDVIGNLDLPPEQYVEFYFESKIQQKYFLRPPNCDTAGDPLEMLMIHNSQKQHHMLKAQKDLCHHCVLQSEINKARVLEVCKAQNVLRERFAELNVFLKECSDKKHLAQIRVVDEQRKHEKFQSLITEYRNNIKVMGEFKTALLGVVKELEPYATVIKTVVEDQNTWDSVKDCMDRCDALMLAQVEIGKMKRNTIEKIERRRKDIIKLSNEASLTALGFINDLSKLEKNYDEARIACLKWQKLLATAKEIVAEATLSNQRTRDGISWMYSLLCRRKGVEKIVQNENIDQQMNFIREELKILNDVVEQCKKYSYVECKRT